VWQRNRPVRRFRGVGILRNRPFRSRSIVACGDAECTPTKALRFRRRKPLPVKADLQQVCCIRIAWSSQFDNRSIRNTKA
jgi:hypothetical protein